MTVTEDNLQCHLLTMGADGTSLANQGFCATSGRWAPCCTAHWTCPTQTPGLTERLFMWRLALVARPVGSTGAGSPQHCKLGLCAASLSPAHWRLLAVSLTSAPLLAMQADPSLLGGIIETASEGYVS